MYAEYGKEKRESLNGRLPLGFWAPTVNADQCDKGLNDKEIEERITGLVKTGM